MKTLAELRSWVAGAPRGTTIPVESLREILGAIEPGDPVSSAPRAEPALSWRVLLWTVDPETRIGVAELLEATGKPRSWLYRHTGPKAKSRIPHRRLDGSLVFVVGEVRAWLREHEELIDSRSP